MRRIGFDQSGRDVGGCVRINPDWQVSGIRLQSTLHNKDVVLTAPWEIAGDLLLAACAPARRGATEDRCGMFNLCDVPAVRADFHHADRE
jgi:hypothetical protein